MRKPHAPRAVTALAAALALLVGAVACGSDNDDGAETTVFGAPGTFRQEILWEQPGATNSSVAVSGGTGDVAYLANTGNGTKPVYLDKSTGQPRWQGALSRDYAATATINIVEQAGKPWVVVASPDTTAKTLTLYTYDAMAHGNDRRPVYKNEFEGEGFAPTARFTTNGVLVQGVAGDGSVVFLPDGGHERVFKPTLRRERTEDRLVNGKIVPTPTTTEEEAYAAYNGGVITKFADGGYTYRGDNGGWTSDTRTPKGVKPGTGSILGVDRGYLVASWLDEKDNEVVVVHTIADGNIIITATVPPADEGTGNGGAAGFNGTLVSDAKGRWYSYGKFVFDTKDRKAYLLRDPITTVSIADGVVYGTGQDSKTRAVDAAEGVPVGPQGYAHNPTAFDGYGNGLFYDPDKERLLAMPLRTAGK